MQSLLWNRLGNSPRSPSSADIALPRQASAPLATASHIATTISS
jgi:hypothetical protein